MGLDLPACLSWAPGEAGTEGWPLIAPQHHGAELKEGKHWRRQPAKLGFHVKSSLGRSDPTPTQRGKPLGAAASHYWGHTVVLGGTRAMPEDHSLLCLCLTPPTNAASKTLMVAPLPCQGKKQSLSLTGFHPLAFM